MTVIQLFSHVLWAAEGRQFLPSKRPFAWETKYTLRSGLRRDNQRVVFGELFQSELFWRVIFMQIRWFKEMNFGSLQSQLSSNTLPQRCANQPEVNSWQNITHHTTVWIKITKITRQVDGRMESYMVGSKITSLGTFNALHENNWLARLLNKRINWTWNEFLNNRRRER